MRWKCWRLFYLSGFAMLLPGLTAGLSELPPHLATQLSTMIDAPINPPDRRRTSLDGDTPQGCPPRSLRRAVAVGLPRSVRFLTAVDQLAREADYFTGVENLPTIERPEATLPLPDRYVRTQQPGLASILSPPHSVHWPVAGLTGSALRLPPPRQDRRPSGRHLADCRSRA